MALPSARSQRDQGGTGCLQRGADDSAFWRGAGSAGQGRPACPPPAVSYPCAAHTHRAEEVMAVEVTPDTPPQQPPPDAAPTAPAPASARGAWLAVAGFVHGVGSFVLWAAFGLPAPLV